MSTRRARRSDEPAGEASQPAEASVDELTDASATAPAGPIVVRFDSPLAVDVLRLGMRLEPGLNEIHDRAAAEQLLELGVVVLPEGEEAKG